MLLQHSQQNENLGRIWWAISTMCHVCLAKGVCLVVSKKHAAFPAHCWTGRCGPRVSHEKISKQAFHAKEKYMQHLRAPYTCDMYINVFAPRLSWLQRWLAVCWLQHLRRQADICLTQEANYIIAACHICHYERLCQWKLTFLHIFVELQGKPMVGSWAQHLRCSAQWHLRRPFYIAVLVPSWNCNISSLCLVWDGFSFDININYICIYI